MGHASLTGRPSHAPCLYLSGGLFPIMSKCEGTRLDVMINPVLRSVPSGDTAVCRRRIARHQTLNISRVGFGERLITDEQHIFRIAHGMIG